MSDTPETDAVASPHIGFYSCATVTAEFARRLERERDEARQQYDDLATEHMLAINKLAEERDQALMDRANGDMATMTINHYERILRERDEAKAIADELAAIAAHCLGSHSFALNDTAIKIAAALKRWKKSQ
jgi:vacuolar-type H+-ATPase subunit E/Vma4